MTKQQCCENLAQEKQEKPSCNCDVSVDVESVTSWKENEWNDPYLIRFAMYSMEGEASLPRVAMSTGIPCISPSI